MTMDFTKKSRSWIYRNWPQHTMNTNAAGAYTTFGSTETHSSIRQSNTAFKMPSNMAQHNIVTAPSRALPSTFQTANRYSTISLPPPTKPTTKVEFLQGGETHSFTLPIACTRREIESLQELAMNTRFGKVNHFPRHGFHINAIGHRLWAECPELRSEKEKMQAAEKIRGGVFDGLSKQEVQWLQEKGWEEERAELNIYLLENDQSGTKTNNDPDPDPDPGLFESNHHLEELDARLERLAMV